MIAVILIGVSLSMDAFAVAVTNGLTLRPRRLAHALWMGVYFGAFQCLMPLLGYFLGSTVSGYVTAVGPYVSFVLLCYIGGKMILDARRGEETDGMASLSHKRLFAMAVATSIDALAVGVSFAFSPPAPGTILSCAVIGCTTFLIAFLGAILGSRIPGIRAQKAETAGGAVLIAIGIKLLLEGILS